MNIFISGATGFIGSSLALRLAGEGHTVHALYRSEEKASCLKRENIKLFKGDLLDKESITEAVRHCDEVYHSAGFTQVWDRDISRIYRLNITGTLNVLHAAMDAGVKRMVFISTAGIFTPSTNGDIISEDSSKQQKFLLPYEGSKTIIEDILRSGSILNPEIIIVNPTRVYGPGELSISNGVTRMIKSYIKGRWRFIPGNGKAVGNYVYIDDVVEGLILSMKKGIPGEQYILGGENISYGDFFQLLSALSSKKYVILKLPRFIMLSISSFLVFLAGIFNTQPLITPSLVKKFSQNWIFSSEKAGNHLGYSPLNMKDGLTKTLEWLSSTGSENNTNNQ